MKTKFYLSAIAMLISFSLFGQDINGKLGTNGQFIIRDTSSTFLTLSQSTGNLSLNRNLIFTTMTAGSQTGVIYKGNSRFIHNYFGSGTTGENTFVGINSGNFTLGGSSANGSFNTGTGYSTLSSLTTGSYNSAFGDKSLYSNTTGNNNSAFGYQALYSNITGIYNSAFGYQALYSNTFNMNSAFGYQSLYSNTTGYYNSAFGLYSLYTNSTGQSNSAFGYQSLYKITTGYQNSAFGDNSLYNTSGNGNSGFGMRSLSGVTTGGYNTGIGIDAGSNITTGSNNTTIGNIAQVPSGTASNQVRIGNTAITYAGIQVAWTITSDINWKQNITSSGLGLGFISKLKPVSYTRINDEKQRTEYGFIAQDIEKALKETGAENSGMITVDDAGRYELRYNDLLAPMVKAIQELKEENDSIKTENKELKERLQKIEQLQNILMKDINSLKTVNN